LTHCREVLVESEESPPPAALDADTRALVSAWVTAHWDDVFGLLYRLSGGSRHESEDLAQDTFLRAAQRRTSFTPGTNLRAWLMRIATNAFLDARRRPMVTKAEPLPEGDEPIADGLGPARLTQGRELGEALEAALAELPATARVVFLLRTREEKSFREIAEAIGSTEETARWHMLQARRR
jgi:RNA polymerase sigma-70 factor (ECF subfamily)